MTGFVPDARDSELRRILVARARADSVAQGSRRLRLVAYGVALLLAGGLVGGGVVTAAASTRVKPAEVSAGLAIIADMTRPQTTLLGELVHATLSGSDVVSLGLPPTGANGLAIATRCVEAGPYKLQFDGKFVEGATCDGAALRADGGVQSIDAGIPETISVGTGSIEVWAMWVEAPPFPTPSELQLETLDDGLVTREEYLAGYDRFAGCMGALGYPLAFVDRSGDVIDYGYLAEAADDGTDELCYATELDDIDASWQLYRGAAGVDPGVYP